MCVYACQTEVKEKDKQENKIASEPKAPVDNHELMDSLITRAILYGDKKAYNEVSNDYYIEGMGEDILYVSMIVADKYNNPEAHFHIYTILNGLRRHEYVDSLGKKTKDFALYHLLKSYELGYKDAIYEIEEVFGEGKSIPKSSYYMKEYAKE